MFVQFSQNLLGRPVSFDDHYIGFWYSSLWSQPRPRPGAVDIVLRLWHISKITRSQLVFKSEQLCASEHIEDQSRARAVGSSARIPSHSCLSICPTWWGRSWSCEPCTCPSYFWFWEDELLSKELMMWTLHLPFLLPNLPRRFGSVSKHCFSGSKFSHLLTTLMAVYLTTPLSNKASLNLTE